MSRRSLLTALALTRMLPVVLAVIGTSAVARGDCPLAVAGVALELKWDTVVTALGSAAERPVDDRTRAAAAMRQSDFSVIIDGHRGSIRLMGTKGADGWRVSAYQVEFEASHELSSLDDLTSGPLQRWGAPTRSRGRAEWKEQDCNAAAERSGSRWRVEVRSFKDSTKPPAKKSALSVLGQRGLRWGLDLASLQQIQPNLTRIPVAPDPRLTGWAGEPYDLFGYSTLPLYYFAANDALTLAAVSIGIQSSDAQADAELHTQNMLKVFVTVGKKLQEALGPPRSDTYNGFDLSEKVRRWLEVKNGTRQFNMTWKTSDGAIDLRILLPSSRRLTVTITAAPNQ